MEELDLNGLPDLKDHEVIDVNGVDLGRVTRAFAEEGTLIRFDVKLNENAKGILGTTKEFASVPPIVIADVDERTVRLSEAGEQIVRPDDPRPLHAEKDLRGAKGRPRKTR